MTQKDLTKKFEKLNKQIDAINIDSVETDSLIHKRLEDYHTFVGYENSVKKITITSSFPVKGGYFVIYKLTYSDHDIEDMYAFVSLESLFMTTKEYIETL